MTMNNFRRIEAILDEYHNREWDLWYLGPCEEIANITKAFSSNEWNKFIEFTKEEKPDDWRIMLAHSFIDRHYGKSKSLVAFQSVKCHGYRESYCALQYLRDLEDIPTWLKCLLAEKIKCMLVEASQQDEVFLCSILSQCKSNYMETHQSSMPLRK